MGITEERLRILKMIQNGQVTAEEGARLLETLREETTERKPAPAPAREPQLFRIQVTDLETGQTKANINMPWSLVSVGIKMGARFARDEIRLEDIIEAIQSGATGKVMDMVDKEGSERVEIYVE